MAQFKDAVIDDFGFSFADTTESHVTSPQDESSIDLAFQIEVLEQQVEEYKKRLHDLSAAIDPLLTNLCRDPDKPGIHWPDRVEKIQQFRNKLKRIVEGKE
jgi:hypothetical protein